MHRLNRYIGKTVLAATFGALAVLVSLIVISEIMTQMTDLEGNYTFGVAMRYVGLLIPGLIYDYLSYATFLGCVIGLSIHAAANELVILQAAGVSLMRIGWAVMRPVLVVIAAGMLWGEYVTPVTTELAENTRAAALVGERANTQRGLWHRDGNEFAYFETVQSNGHLFGITRYQFDAEGRLLSSLYAKEGSYESGYWLLEDGRESRLLDGRMVPQSFDEKKWQTDLNPEQLKLLVLEPDTLSIQNLYRYAQIRDRQGLESSQYWISFWRKVMQPLTILGLVLVGMSFIFGSLRESTMGFRLTLAVLVGVAFEMAQKLLGTSSLALGLPAMFAVLLPNLVAVAVGLWLLRRV